MGKGSAMQQAFIPSFPQCMYNMARKVAISWSIE